MKIQKHRHFLTGILRFFGLRGGITGGYVTVGSARPDCPVGLGITGPARHAQIKFGP